MDLSGSSLHKASWMILFDLTRGQLCGKGPHEIAIKMELLLYMAQWQEYIIMEQ